MKQANSEVAIFTWPPNLPQWSIQIQIRIRSLKGVNYFYSYYDVKFIAFDSVTGQGNMEGKRCGITTKAKNTIVALS